MTRKEFGQWSMFVQTLFDRQEFLPTELIQDLWYERLRQYPQDTVKRAVLRLWETQKWLPTMSEMLDAIESERAEQRSQLLMAENEERVVRFCQMLKSGDRAALPEGKA